MAQQPGIRPRQVGHKTEEEEHLLPEEVRPLPLLPMYLIDQSLGSHINHAILDLLPIDTALQRVPFSAGNIRFHINQWEVLTSDHYILQIVKGWVIPFLEEPHQRRVPSQYHMQKQERLQLSKEIKNMLVQEAVREVSPVQDQFVSPIFLREKREAGKFRPIINLKELNGYIPYVKLKMESLSDLKGLMIQNDFMVKLDLKDAFLAVPLNQRESGKFVRFKWEGQLYQCLTLMFGLGPAPRIFTKLLKVPMSTL